ncbi:8573_t:CDS:1, partial [Cetraspora pellucida]
DEHLSYIYNTKNLLFENSYIWLIADAKETNDRTKESEYAKKFYEDSIGTSVFGLAAYTYGKVLIEDEDMRDEAKKKFETSFFQGGYIEASKKLKEYFNDDINIFYKEKYDKKDIEGIECFYYASVLLSESNISKNNADYIMDILFFGLSKEDNNCLSLLYTMLKENMGTKHKEKKESVKELYNLKFSNYGIKYESINKKLLKKIEVEKKFNPEDKMKSKDLSQLNVIYKNNKASKSNSSIIDVGDDDYQITGYQI